jgi:DHA1 family tetracycline resistance protein-like MFS transporter
VASGFKLLGWLLAAYPIAQFFSTPLLGQLSDKYGRKPVLAFSLLGTALGYVLFAVGIIQKNIPLLFISRALDGITGGNLSVAQAVIADTSTPKTRTRNFGLIGMCFGLGFVLGPYIGSKLSVPNVSFYGLGHTPSWFSAATPFWFTTILSLVNVLLVLFKLKETIKVKSSAKFLWNKSLHNIRVAATDPSLRTVFPTVFFFVAGFGFFRAFFQVFLSQKLHFTTGNIGDSFAFVGICIALAQGIITPIVAKRYKNYQILKVSLFFNGIVLMGLAMVTKTWELIAVTPLFAIMNGQSMANATSLVSASASKEIQGEVLGINASVQATADSITSVLSGYIAASLSVKAPVLVGGGLILVGWVIYMLFFRPSDHILNEHHDEDMAMAH